MDENELEQSLELYRAQLSQVQQAISAAGETEELQKLVTDLQELITLTEGSLLSLKKSKLLKTIEDAESSSPRVPQSSAPETSIDDEYAAFQVAVQGDLEKEDNSRNSNLQPSARSRWDNSNYTPQPSTSQFSSLPSSTTKVCVVSDSESDSAGSSSSDSEDENGATKGDNTVDEELSKLVGMKCCAPFSHDWGKLDYHNALVMSAARDSQTDEILVKVMYTTPTHRSMQPCKFFLDGHCKFNDDQCNYSHGRTVTLDAVREFAEADHSKIAVDTKCLACYTDEIWYPATVTEVKDDVVSVHFDDYGEDLDVNMTQVVPSALQAEDMASDREEEEAEASTSTVQENSTLVDSDEEEEELPHFLWQPPKSTAAMGEWEAHTRGIGSKLMSKMGYIPGQGLGSQGQGKAEPVPIMLLPQGKSLDRIMELKAMAGNEDLFNAMKRMERQKRKADKKREEESENGGAAASAQSPSVFDFINTRLAGKQGDPTSLAKSAGRNSDGNASGASNSAAQSRRHITEHELHKKTDKDVNLQVFKTHGEIRNVERQIARLKEQLARNENKDRRMAGQVKTKLAEQEAYLSRLQTSSSALEKHQKRRSTSKKLAIF
ncbi:zinc finger CCCH-type with G patch domain-containing protein-like [Littorina saxatilis]|uniref:Zinc finger CCCH-type with G patch domain-containing protein n=1 Tax=Littorina saxatilis TaxID=31220 RepID=A0AAN9G515_9CAEN